MRFYDSEIKVLEVLWEHGELTAGQIAEILGKEDGGKEQPLIRWFRNVLIKAILKGKNRNLPVRL